MGELLSRTSIRDAPADLLTIIVVTFLLNVAVFAPLVRDTPVRIPIGLFFLLFVPGYALVAALFPEAEPSTTSVGGMPTLSIDRFDRAGLSLGLSIAVVPILGLVLTLTPWGLTAVSFTVLLSACTVALAGVAAYRRLRLPETERFRVPYREWVATARGGIVESDSKVDVALIVLLVVSIVLAFGSVAYAVGTTSHGETYSELYILMEDDDGELVSDGYPTEFESGDSEEVVLGVANHERQAVNYTIVLVEQDVETTNNETIVHSQEELDWVSTQLSHNETWLHEHEIAPTMTGDEIRIAWLLYLGDDVPEDLSTDTADHFVHFWIDVEETEDEE